jgi:hypothetical protein
VSRDTKLSLVGNLSLNSLQAKMDNFNGTYSCQIRSPASFKAMKARVLHFKESTNTGYVPSTDTRTILLGYAPMAYLFYFYFFRNVYIRGTPVVRVWYTNPKKRNFFPFSFIRFFIYRKIYVCFFSDSTSSQHLSKRLFVIWG